MSALPNCRRSSTVLLKTPTMSQLIRQITKKKKGWSLVLCGKAIVLFIAAVEELLDRDVARLEVSLALIIALLLNDNDLFFQSILRGHRMS
jgi:hypothetical protein